VTAYAWWTMAFSDNTFLAKLREHADRARRLFSNPQKPQRKRMVVRAFLRSIGEAFEDSEIIASGEEPIDIRFRDAEFQIMEIVGDRRRGLDWRRRQDISRCTACCRRAGTVHTVGADVGR